MRTEDLGGASTAVEMFASAGSGMSPLPAPIDLSVYNQLIQHMASIYRCDPAAVAASLATINCSATNYLPFALTVPNDLSLTPNRFSANQSPSRVLNSSFSPKESTINEELTNGSVETKLSPSKKYTMSYQHSQEKNKKIKCNRSFTHDSNGALDLSTQGLKSLYSNYRRISLDQLKPKTVDDIWVENDRVLSWTESKIAAYNPVQKQFMCVDCESAGFLSRVAEHWLGAHANLRVFRCPKCPYTSAWSRCVKMHITRQHNEQCADTTMWKENATLMEVTKLMQELRTKVETRIDSTSTLAEKRFYCPHCPYATDRRDLYTRHENIHKDEKPFHCYLCFKQFNRADHVKKHFVRMHPDTPYDIGKIRKQPGVRGRTSPTANVANSPVKLLKPSLPSITECSTEQSPSPPIKPYRPTHTETQRTPSPLPLTVQNLRVHNMNMNKQYPISPPSPDITVDVVNIDQPQSEVNSIEAQFPQIQTKAYENDDKKKTSFTCQTLSFKLNQKNSLQQSVDKPADSIDTNQGELTVPTSSGMNVRGKKRAVKSFLCPYCHWSGSDNWCLKRHMNTHIKPFACTMCEYKAARAERLSTHVLKVHNKRICNKCSFISDTQEKLLDHVREEHHNNPYSRRHTCGICGLTLENQTALQKHLTSTHAPPLKKTFPDVNKNLVTTCSEKSNTNNSVLENDVHDLSLNSSLSSSAENNQAYICPVNECDFRPEDTTSLASHLETHHNNERITKCPHCAASLAINDERSKDHWMMHHKDVCAMCVHVFTSIYGAQLWKKVHVKHSQTTLPLGMDDTNNLDSIVSGLSKKRPAPDDEETRYNFESDQSDNLSFDSENQDSDSDRHVSKRPRKQSCPKKVINSPDEIDAQIDEDFRSTNKIVAEKSDNKHQTCPRCPDLPSFSSYGRLRMHYKNKHRINNR